TSSVAPEIGELRTKAPTTTTMVPAGQFARNMPHTFDQFTFQVGRNFVPRTVFQKPKDGVSALIDMAIPSKTTAVPLIGKEMFDIDLPPRVPEFATTTRAAATAASTTPATTTTTAATTTRREEIQATTVDFKFPFAIPDRVEDDEKKKSIEESLKEIKDAFKRIRQLVKEDGKEDASEVNITSAEEDISPPPTNPTTVSTTTRVPTTVPTTTASTTTTTTTVRSTTTTAAEKQEDSSDEELIKADTPPSWLDLSVFAENHRSLTTSTAASASSTTTTTEEPTTAPTEPPPKEALVMQLFAVSEKKKDEMKEAQEKKMKESEFGGNLFDEITERGDAARFSTVAPPSTKSRTFAPPPVPPLSVSVFA
ncbi:hypothetical protein PMAYCL1PPCAC_07642, partial [Pristionchus mayeri]